MSRASRERESRLREFKDCDDEYRETGSKEAAQRRFWAMRSKDVRESDFVEAQERVTQRILDENRAMRERVKKLKMTDWQKEN